MATIKVQQKLGQDDFKKLLAQIKGDGVRIIEKVTDVHSPAPSLGKVSNAFNLGKKVEAMVTMKDPETPLTGYHFHNVHDQWFLVQQPA